MKVLHCITGLSPDGAQRMLARLNRGLHTQGVQSVIVSLSKQEAFGAQLKQDGATVHFLGVHKGIPLPHALIKLKRILEVENPDLIQGWMYHANIAVFLASKISKNRLPIVWNVRRGLDDYSERKLLTRLMIRAGVPVSRYVDGIVYCTDQSAFQHEELGYDREKTLVIGNGFDTSSFCPSKNAHGRLRAQLGLPREAVLIGNVGRDDAAKGHSLLIEGFAEISGRHPHANLILVGRGIDSNHRSLAGLVSRKGLSGRVHMLGERSDVNQIYQGLDLYCSSSISEGFPNVIAEAMSSGVPCIATDTGASRSLVGDTGIVVEPRSVSAISQGLDQAMGLGASKRAILGTSARKRIEETFSIESVVQRYKALYEQTIAGVPVQAGERKRPRKADSVRPVPT